MIAYIVDGKVKKLTEKCEGLGSLVNEFFDQKKKQEELERELARFAGAEDMLATIIHWLRAYLQINCPEYTALVYEFETSNPNRLSITMELRKDYSSDAMNLKDLEPIFCMNVDEVFLVGNNKLEFIWNRGACSCGCGS